MSTSLPAKGGTLEKMLAAKFKEVQSTLPGHLSPRRMMRIGLSVYRKNPKLTQCSAASAVDAILQAAQLGLELGTVQGQAFLVPYKNEVQLQIGYKGLIDLAMRSGYYSWIQAHMVYENDIFDYEHGTNEFLRHRPAIKNRGYPIAAYAIAKMKDGSSCFHVLTMEQIESYRAMSKAQRGGPWDTHFDAMSCKTAIRQLLKPLPASAELRAAVSLDERAEAGIPQFDDAEFTIEPTAEGAVLQGAGEPGSPTMRDDPVPTASQDEPDDWDLVPDEELIHTVGKVKMDEAQRQKYNKVCVKGSWDDLRKFAREISPSRQGKLGV